jgi:hypothetical protein
MIIPRLFVLMLLCLCFLRPAFGEDNACLNCHRHLKQATAAGRAYLQWKNTVHDRAGVTCDLCHGGNPDGATLEKAHNGVRPASDPESATYTRNIPELCGKCHVPQLQEFTRSKHYQVLDVRNKAVSGPTCITCHGAMNTAILSPVNVADACRRCHNGERRGQSSIPEEAQATLSLIYYARNTIAWSQEFVLLARREGRPTAAAEQRLQEAVSGFQASKAKWHSFDFKEILRLIDGAYESAREAKRLVESGNDQWKELKALDVPGVDK